MCFVILFSSCSIRMENDMPQAIQAAGKELSGAGLFVLGE